jgi:hypothetical protein
MKRNDNPSLPDQNSRRDILIAATTHLLSLLHDPHWGLPTDTPMLELD